MNSFALNLITDFGTEYIFFNRQMNLYKMHLYILYIRVKQIRAVFQIE